MNFNSTYFKKPRPNTLHRLLSVKDDVEVCLAKNVDPKEKLCILQEEKE